MKFYNPFKPHIIEDNVGRFYIRHWNTGWMYLERETFDRWWVSTENAINLCSYQNQAPAIIALRNYNDKIAKRTIKVNRVL